MRKHRKKRLFFSPKEKISQRDILGEHASNVLGAIMFLISLAILISPLIAYFLVGTSGLVALLLLVLVTSPMTSVAIKNYRFLSFRTFIQSIKYLIKNKLINSIVLYTTNILILFFIGFNTIIPTNLVISLYILLIALPYIIKAVSKSPEIKKISPITPPSLLSVFLIINFVISFDEKSETYYFTNNYQTVSGIHRSSSIKQKSTLITLTNNAYHLNYGVRMFIDFDKVSRHNKIEYHFRTGVFGIKVLKDFNFF